MARVHSDLPPRTNTDSMVTVPLSPNSDLTKSEGHSLEAPQTPTAASAPEETLLAPVAYQEPDPDPPEGEGEGEAENAEADTDTVNWAQLEKSEEQEPRDTRSDESTALLLARLEQENNALVTNPKSGLCHRSPSNQPPQRPSRSQSINQIRRLIHHDPRASLRDSQIPAPPMTELEFWAALVADYPQTAQRLPTLTTNKIRGGVPPPLRGVVWPSLAGARDAELVVEYQRLCGETSPYEGLIGKDIGRSFPNVEMFRDPNGEGQQMLARVLKCFSLYDSKIGYCQGLGFVVGPLLMHMTDAEAFCVLVRLMDHYDLRTCYLPDLSGLHLHVYQFQNLLSRLRPELFAHLESLHVEPVYVSQWFLSFFAVACPLPMLLRIYDVLFLEGACETLMRVALSLMQRNEKKIRACTEFEEVMPLLLSRSLWDIYAFNADDFVNDFVSLTSLVTKESLQALEASYHQSQGVPTGIAFPQMQQAAARFLGRFWAGSNNNAGKSSSTLSPNTNSPSKPGSIRRSPSKQSLTSTLTSVESTSDASTAPTDLSSDAPSKPRKSALLSPGDRDLHTQIEDLLRALSDLQRQQADLTRSLQQEREEREEDTNLARSLLSYIKDTTADHDNKPAELIAAADARFTAQHSPSTPLPEPTKESTQTKQQLREDAARWQEMHAEEASRCRDLARRIDEHETETASLREQLREARGRIQDGYRDRQRLERTVRDLRTSPSPLKSPTSETPPALSPTSPSEKTGLRELTLVRTNSEKKKTDNNRSSMAAPIPKRASSLGLPVLRPDQENAHAHGNGAAEETLLLELVHAKTAEAVARQELEEVKAKLEGLRKMVGASARPGLSRGTTDRSSMGLSLSRSETGESGGGFFSGWSGR